MAEMGIAKILDRLSEAADGETVSIGDIFEAFGSRSYGPLLFIIGSISFSPIGAIPGASIFFGSLTILLMGQYLFGRSSPWLPGWMRRRSVGSKRLNKAIEKVKPVLDRADGVIRTRLEPLAEPPWSQALALVAILIAATMYPLALVPWGVMVPSLALAMIGLGFAAKDGLLLLVAWFLAAASFGCLGYFFL